jgi:hypothetical protein
MEFCKASVVVLLILHINALHSQNVIPVVNILSQLSSFDSHVVSTNPVVILFWTFNSTHTRFTVASETASTGWLGFGKSETGMMFPSTVYLGFPIDSKVEKYYLDGHTTTAFTLLEPPTESMVGSSETYGILSVTVPKSEIDPTQPNYFIFAIRTEDPDLGIHSSYFPAEQSLTLDPYNGGSTYTDCDSCAQGESCSSSVFCSPSGDSTNPDTFPPAPVPTVDLRGYTNKFVLIPGELTLYAKPITTGSTELSLALQGPSSGYVAVGWSPNGNMLNSDAVIGWSDGSDVPFIQSYKLPDQSAPEDLVDLSITLVSVIDVNGKTTLFFTRSISSGKNPINQQKGNTLIGAISNSKAISYHTAHSGAVQANFYTGTSATTARFGYPEAHGLLMFLSWGLVLPLGVVWARYTRYMPDAIWFKIHRIAQYGAFPVAILAFILIVSSSKVPFGSHPHHIVGTIIMILGVLQIISAFFRPHKEGHLTRSRVMFEYFHWWNGRFLIAAAIYQIFSGIFH